MKRHCPAAPGRPCCSLKHAWLQAADAAAECSQHTICPEQHLVTNPLRYRHHCQINSQQL
jgi:hypothetical protein